MSNPSVACSTAPLSFVIPQDRKPLATWGGLAGSIFVLIAILAALYRSHTIGIEELTALLPSSPIFWVLFLALYLASPVCDWLIYRRIWELDSEAFPAILRKMLFNEVLIGYSGEVYLYTWARRQAQLISSPFGAVKDVAVLSAAVGNAITLVAFLMAWPLLSLLPLQQYSSTIAFAFAIIIMSSLVLMVWRGAIFSLNNSELRFVSAVHLTRVLVTIGLTMLIWHLVLPGVSAFWWPVLIALRLMISRLPIVANKDTVFAGVALVALGQEQQIAAMMVMMASAILLFHVVLGLGLGLAHLIMGAEHGTRSR